MWNNPSKSVNISFNNLSHTNELKLPKLSGNLKNYKETSFIIPDIFLDKNSVVLDVGANIGRFTSVFSRYGCRVFSFEPTSATFNILKNRFRDINNIFLKQNACWIKEDKIKLYHHELSKYNKVYWSDGNSLIKNKTNVLENDYEEVEAIDLSKFIFEITKDKPIDLIKMDIEGAEIEVINHLIDTKAIYKVNYLICETHEQKNTFLLEKTNLLKKKVEELNLDRKIYFNWI
jgi:FkbM family methyltransferase